MGRGPGYVLVRTLPCFLFLVLLVACGEPVATPEPVFLQASGSASLAPLAGELATAFHERFPGTQITVHGLGTQFGLEALRSGEADLALASWLPAGLDPRWRATVIARDGIAIVVHPDNPLGGLGLLQLADLFSGRVYDWAAVGAPASLGEVLPVSREEGSGTRAVFEALVMAGQRVSPRALLAPSPQAVVAYVAGHPGAIGYLSPINVTSEVRVIAVEGELPAPENAARGTYALTRELWLVTAEPPPAPVQQFLDFVLSPAGQQIVGQDCGRVR